MDVDLAGASVPPVPAIPAWGALAQTWTPIAFSRELGRRPRAVRIGGVDVVLFRDGAGSVAAMLDRCPHRSVALSKGRVVDGHLVCPFHGWRFARDGACVAIPWVHAPDGLLARAAVFAFRAVERAGLIWLACGDPPDLQPEMDDALLDPRMARLEVRQCWAVHWTRAMENMLDWPHMPFVHRSTIGRALRRHGTAQLSVALEKEPNGFRARPLLDGVPFRDAWITWRAPNAMVLNLPSPPGLYRIHVWCVPAGDNDTEMLIVVTRRFGAWNPLLKLADLVGLRVLAEDRAVVETSPRGEVPDPAHERSVATDAPTLHFRAWYRARATRSPLRVIADDAPRTRGDGSGSPGR